LAERVTAYEVGIKEVEVGMLETDDCKGRTGFYDEVGVVRDTVQNHLMMMLAVMAMDTSGAYPDEAGARKALLHQLETATLDKVVRLGQYRSYNDHVNEDRARWGEPPLEGVSGTPTYLHATLTVDSAQSFLHGVPVHFKSGKALNIRRSYVEVTFQDDTKLVFNLQGPANQHHSGALILTTSVPFRLPEGWQYVDSPMGATAVAAVTTKRPFAYEFLLRAALEGRKENFVRLDEVLEAWRIWTPLLKQLEANDGPAMELYDHGAALQTLAVAQGHGEL